MAMAALAGVESVACALVSGAGIGGVGVVMVVVSVWFGWEVVGEGCREGGCALVKGARGSGAITVYWWW